MTCRNSEGTAALEEGQPGFAEFAVKQSVAGGGDDDDHSRRKEQPRHFVAEEQQRLQ